MVYARVSCVFVCLELEDGHVPTSAACIGIATVRRNMMHQLRSYIHASAGQACKQIQRLQCDDTLRNS